MMRRVILAVWVGGLVVQQAHAQGGAIVHSQIDPQEGVVGQQIRLLVDVLFPGEMLHPPRVEIPSAARVQVFRFESQATTIDAQIAGQGYVGQRFEFDIYPRRNGRLVIPAASVTLLDQAGRAVAKLSGTDQTIVARTPAGFDPAQPIVAAPAVTVREEWRPRQPPFKIGDAVTLIVTRTAETVPGLSFVAPIVPRIEGLRVYADPPIIQDRVERGDVTGVRIDRMTFVAERSGDFVLPGVTQRWWNTDVGDAETITRPSFAMIVVPDVVEISRPKWRAYFLRFPILLDGFVVAAVLAITCLLVFAFRSRGRKSTNQERKAFSELLWACKQHDAKAAYRAAILWQRLVRVQMEMRALRGFDSLERAVFLGETWSVSDASELRKELAAHRSAFARAKKLKQKRQSLHGLNDPIN